PACHDRDVGNGPDRAKRPGPRMRNGPERAGRSVRRLLPGRWPRAGDSGLSPTAVEGSRTLDGRGRPVGAIRELAQAADHFGRVNNALQVLRKMKTLDRFVSQREVNMFAKLFEVNDAARLAAYAEQVLSEIAAKAPRQRNELKRTLLVYFDAQHNVKRTAEILGLHINTVRQRLEALRQITGGWDDPVKALEMHVALRLNAILA